MRYNCPIGKVLTLVVLPALISISCSTYKLITPEPEALHKELKAGDIVKIITNEGKYSQFKIVQISKDSLFSKHQIIAFDQIAGIKKINSAATPNMIRLRRVALTMMPFIVATIALVY